MNDTELTKPWMRLSEISPVRPSRSRERAFERDRSVLTGLDDSLRPSPMTPSEKNALRSYREEDISRGLIHADDHKKVMDEQAGKHEEEIRRGDAIHARHCNNLVVALEEAKNERDAYAAENASLLSEVEVMRQQLATHRGFKDGYETERKEKRVVGDRIQKLQQECDEKEREIERLHYETSKLFNICQKQEADTKRAFQELKTEHDQLIATNKTLEKRLQEATIDYRNLDKNQMSLEEQVHIGKTRYRELSEYSKRRENLETDAWRQLNHVERMLAELRTRVDERTTAGSTPVRELKLEFEEFNREVGKLGQILHPRP
eukprot:TRINITY_DN7776_c0_g1_i1.p1 TRINITY_DN7776_c0_g1~~TRINITY_DN7776_c0_g1_i1.p1  ORF type:complete len:319 (+),score=74.75 TRINITY_DN7776_c0_g1_i1:38-994(+)